MARAKKSVLSLPDGVPVVFAVALSLWPLILVAFLEIVLVLQREFYVISSVVPGIPLVSLAMLRLRKSQPVLFAVLVIALGGLALIALLEIYVARPLLLMIFACLAVVLSIPVVILVVQKFVKTALIVYLLFLCGFVVFHNVPWSSRHGFLRELGRIKPGRYLDRTEPGIVAIARRHGPGMTFAEVEQLMGGYPVLIGEKWYRPLKEPSNGRVRFAANYEPDINARREVKVMNGRAGYQYSGEARLNGDSGWVDFRDGRVVRVKFLPD
jgi:hypothetical protein